MDRVVIIGAGFVGLQEAILFAKNNHYVWLVDINDEVVERINSKNKDNIHIKEKYVLENWDKVKDKIEATTDYSVIKDANIIIISVDTPIKVFGNDLIKGLLKNEDITYFIDFLPLEKAIKKVKKYIESGSYLNSLVTIFPGGTEKYIIKPLQEAGFILGKDIFVTHTPERLDAGSKYTPEDILKNLGFLDSKSKEIGLKIYKDKLGLKINPGKLELVELSKLHENAFRLLNIAFVQESLIKYGEDLLDVIELAGSKPFGFMKFYPSPYAGGTCLVKDAIMYWYATKNELIRQALIINEKMPEEFAKIIYKKIKEKRYRRILFYGFGFKPSSPYYIKKELNPIERLIDNLKKLDNSLEVKKYDPNILDKSDFENEEEAKKWADVIIFWDYKKIFII